MSDPQQRADAESAVSEADAATPRRWRSERPPPFARSGRVSPGGSRRVPDSDGGLATGTQGYEALVRAAEAGVEVYTPATAMKRAQEAAVTFLDVRTVIEVSSGVIPGAVHAPRGRLEAHLVPGNPRYVRGLDEADELICYCASGARSALAARRARELGYESVGHLVGGFEAWRAAGGTTVDGPTAGGVRT